MIIYSSSIKNAFGAGTIMQTQKTIYEQIQKDKGSYKGVTLSYSGAQYLPSSFQNNKYSADNPELSPLQAFTERFKNIGALVIRFHLGQGQRAGLLQQVSKFNYSENPVERPAQGGDEETLFFKEESTNSGRINGDVLEFASHLTLGRSKVLNERAQPLVHVNQKSTYGEQGIWDIIHAPVWNVGRAMKYELNKQGFIYINCPAQLNPKEKEILDRQLRTSGKPPALVCEEMGVEAIESDISKLDIYLDDKQEFTKEPNGLAIANNKEDKKYAPMGWIIHKKTGEVLPQEVTEDIIRVSAIDEGGFYEKRPTQQKILQSGNLMNSSGLGLFTQNQAFNAMYVIFDYLQRYNFDPRPLLDNSLQIAYNRLQSTLEKDPSLIDDFLVGALQDEMVQHLRVSQPKSIRSVLPIRFTNSFPVTINNLKTIAYAFGIKDKSEQPIFRGFDDNAGLFKSENMIDSQISGTLVTPSFNTAAHVAAIVSTAELIAEQMILEQLIPDAFAKKNPEDSALFILLVDILGKEEADKLFTELMDETAKLPTIDNKLIVGAQFAYCKKLVQKLQNGLGLDSMNILLCKLSKPGLSTQEVLENLDSRELEQLTKVLERLFKIGDILQELPLTTAAPEYSRGINAGLAPLIAHVNPHLAVKLNIQTQSIIKADIPAIDKEKVRDRMSTRVYNRCPFLAKQSKEQKPQQVSETNDVLVSKNTGPSFFQTIRENQGKITAVLLGAAYIGLSSLLG
ncbi:TPA: Dot/Icm T4SS effector Ceg17 [Legionella pneumophila]